MRSGTRWRRRYRSERIQLRVTSYQKQRWERVAPHGNISAWLRALADAECNKLPRDRSIDRLRL
jgi:hypothetical protein